MLRFVSATLLAAVLLAQGYADRPISRAPRAPTAASYPFGNTTVPFRFSQIHDDVPAGLITGMRFRHNLTTTTYAAHSITIDAWMSTSLNASTAADTTFDNNHGVDKIQVITNRTYNMPASTAGQAPGDWLLDYPFDIPFVFAGAPRLAGLGSAHHGEDANGQHRLRRRLAGDHQPANPGRSRRHRLPVDRTGHCDALLRDPGDELDHRRHRDDQRQQPARQRCGVLRDRV